MLSRPYAPLIGLSKGRIERRNVFRKKGLVKLGSFGKKRGAERCSETASEVSQEVENSGRVARLFHSDIDKDAPARGTKNNPIPKPWTNRGKAIV